MLSISQGSGNVFIQHHLWDYTGYAVVVARVIKTNKGGTQFTWFS